jgi:hypothetical protein
MSATLPTTDGKSYENRGSALLAILQGLKAQARELNLPLIAL